MSSDGRAIVIRRTIATPLAAAGALLLGAATAQAAPFVDVTYDLGDSSATSLVVTPAVTLDTLSPPQVSGSMKIRYASDSASGLAPGPSTLLTFNLSVHGTVGLTFATPSGGTGTTVVNTGNLRFHLTSPVTGGTLLPGGTVDPLGGIGQLLLTGTVHCYRLCAVIGAPISTPVPILTDVPANPFSQPLGMLYGALGASHTVTGIQYADFYVDVSKTMGTAANLLATTFIVGREVMREPVPEPSTLPLLGVGLASLGAARSFLRRARTHC